MTEKEREFKVKKIQKYNEELKKDTVSMPMILGALSILFVVLGAVQINQNSNDLLMALWGAIVSLGGGTITMWSVETIVDSIATKANLKTEVERLKEEIKIDMLNNPENYNKNNEEERGHSR